MGQIACHLQHQSTPPAFHFSSFSLRSRCRFVMVTQNTRHTNRDNFFFHQALALFVGSVSAMSGHTHTFARAPVYSTSTVLVLCRVAVIDAVPRPCFHTSDPFHPFIQSCSARVFQCWICLPGACECLAGDTARQSLIPGLCRLISFFSLSLWIVRSSRLACASGV